MKQFTLGQFSFGQLENIVACLEVILFSRHWLFCSSPGTFCKAMLLRIAELAASATAHNCSYWRFWLTVSKVASALVQ